MSLRLALASAPVSLKERYGPFVGAANTEPSFALLLLAARAQQQGVEARIVEASSFDLTVEETLERILACEPRVVGLTATTSGIWAAAELAARLKRARPDVIVIVGGCHVSALPEETLRSFEGFDLAVVGEGEETLAQILTHVQRHREVPSALPGTAERCAGGVRVNPPRPLIPDLDSLPFPAWSLLDGFPRAFHPSPARAKRTPCASVVLTRGCPNRCTFCDRSVFGRRCRSYSPSYAVRMLRELRERFGVKEILVEDDTFVLRKGHVREFCERLIAERVDLTWSCLGRADRVDLELLRLMRRAGCWHISFGVESGDPGILRAVNKNLVVEQIERAAVWCAESGIRTKGFFMVGFPGETEASLEATAALACRLPLDDITVTQLTPFPGSEIYESVEAYGAFDRDWRRMNGLETVFVPAGLSTERLEAARARIIRRFYLRPRVLLRKGARLLRNPGLLGGMLRSFLAFTRIVKAVSS